MAVALELAALGRGEVEPNPQVGAVIVRGGQEIARGWHGRFGGRHAETEAIAAAAKAGLDLAGATMYVTLEPCRHYGKQPPCTRAILAARIARVVVAMEDPDRNVAGRGIESLRGAGVVVDVGICRPQARLLLAAYCKLRLTGRPWVICKWAQTTDGYIALPPEAGRWISGEPARAQVHALRARCDGVLVGVETVLADDPLLNNRSGAGRHPARVVIDSTLRMPLDCQLSNSPAVAPVIVATTQAALTERSQTAEALARKGVEVLALPPNDDGRVDLDALLVELGRRQWTHLLVEGGAEVLTAFIDGGLADELLVYVSPRKAPPGSEQLARFDITELRQRLGMDPSEKTQVGDDQLLRFILAE